MARLIDAELLKQNCRITGGSSDNFVVVDLATLGRVIDQQPTVDAVEVVHCEDCVYGRDWGLTIRCMKFNIKMRRMDFCNYGCAKMDGGDSNE